MSIDYTISPLIEKIFAPEDLNTTGHTIFFHRKNHTVSMKKKNNFLLIFWYKSLQVFYHKNWDRLSGAAISLEDAEFSSNYTETNANLENEKMNFGKQINTSIEYA